MNHINSFLLFLVVVKTLFLIILVSRLYRSNRIKSRLNDELQLKNESIVLQQHKISEQNQVLTKLNQTKDKLLSILSHDLRSPLASIMNTLHLIRMGALTTKEYEKILNALHHKAINVSQMLDNILNWANSQQFSIEPQFSKVHFSEAIEEVLTVARMIAEEKGITINNKSADRKYIYADLNHVKIIIQNLVSNAIKFTHQGGTINIMVTEKKAHQILHVVDNGMGMSPEKVDKLFRTVGNGVSDTGTNQESGTGIGLTLIKEFVSQNLGKVEVRSEVGKGTEIQVHFTKYESRCYV